MLLEIDFSGLELEIGSDVTDIRLDVNDDLTVKMLIQKLCEGIEKLGDVTIAKHNRVYILDKNGVRYKNEQKVKRMQLNEWDTLFLIGGV